MERIWVIFACRRADAFSAAEILSALCVRAQCSRQRRDWILTRPDIHCLWSYPYCRLLCVRAKNCWRFTAYDTRGLGDANKHPNAVTMLVMNIMALWVELLVTEYLKSESVSWTSGLSTRWVNADLSCSATTIILFTPMLDDRYLGKVSRRLYVALAKTLCNPAISWDI
jgi:hypothetical protein